MDAGTEALRDLGLRFVHVSRARTSDSVGLFQGRAGVIYALAAVATLPGMRVVARQAIDAELRAIERPLASLRDVGLGSGLAGVAFALGSAGLTCEDADLGDFARGLFDRLGEPAPSGQHSSGSGPRLGLRDGLAGVGLTLLWAYEELGYRPGIDLARDIACRLSASSGASPDSGEPWILADHLERPRPGALDGGIGVALLFARMLKNEPSEEYRRHLLNGAKAIRRTVLAGYGPAALPSFVGSDGPPSLGWGSGMTGLVSLWGLLYEVVGDGAHRSQLIQGLEQLYHAVIWRTREERRAAPESATAHDALTHGSVPSNSICDGYLAVARCLCAGYRVLQGNKVGGFPMTCGHLTRVLTHRAHECVAANLANPDLDHSLMEGASGIVAWLVQYDQLRRGTVTGALSLPWDFATLHAWYPQVTRPS